MTSRFCCLALGFMIGCCQAVVGATVSLPSLLDEMVDRSSVARLPDPAYTCSQASSYSRDSKAKDQPGWFANGDRSHFLREETNQGRAEWVMMDAEGPGSIVRWWVTGRNYQGTIRVYLDGAAEPAIETRVDKLVGGDLLVGPPLSEMLAGGHNLYLPIPYAKRCKVTYDRNSQKSGKREDILYYQINYRTYTQGTRVESFSMARLAEAKDRISQIQKTLLNPALSEPKNVLNASTRGKIEPGLERGLEFKEPGAVYRLSIRLDAKDKTQALRSTVLAMECDGEPTVWCPVGDFFGSGVGVNPYKDWYRRVYEDGKMTCWWVMPFEKECKISLINLGEQDVEVSITAANGPWKWDTRSMHFRTNWRQQRGIETADGGKKAFDWNYLEAEGQGVFVGDSLALVNRSLNWWGEGDEKIYVDGEAFPSHFGTGTEDYYGYAWCTPKFFESPFHAQPRAEGPRNYGNVTNTRVRLLDAIPFDKSFQFDMEVWHWKKTKIDYAATTYWYGRPGATANVLPSPPEARQPVRYQMQAPPSEPKKPGKKQ